MQNRVRATAVGANKDRSTRRKGEERGGIDIYPNVVPSNFSAEVAPICSWRGSESLGTGTNILVDRVHVYKIKR